MDLFAAAVLFVCTLAFLAVVFLTVWARKHPAPSADPSDPSEREWQDAIK